MPAALDTFSTAKPWRQKAGRKKGQEIKKTKIQNMNLTTENMGSIDESVTSEFKNNPLGVRPIVSAALALWLGLVFVLGAQGAFVGSAGSPPLAILLGLAIPLGLFFAAYLTWGAFRAFVLGADLRLVTAIQGWRCAGLGFLSLYAHGVLPALFALPAGLGDMAIGVTAPWILLSLIKDSSFVTGRRYNVWNILGIVDLVIAVSMGTISSGFLPGIAGNVTTSAMAQLPLVLIPSYMVPLFIMLHFTALAQARQSARSARPAATPCPCGKG